MTSRFVEATPLELIGLQESSVPRNTRRSNKTITNLYSRWQEWRKTSFPQKESPPDLADQIHDKPQLARLLSQFFCEIRTKSGENYRSDSMNTFYASMNRSLQEMDPTIDLYDNPEFHALKEIVNGKIKQLRRKEHAPPTQASAITSEMEGKLFELGKLGKAGPDQLMNTCMHKLAKYFGLRGGSEIRDVRYSNLIFTRLPGDEVKIVFCENQSKTNPRGLQGASHSPYRGPHIESCNYEFSLFQLINLYLNKLPEGADLNKSLWFTPLKRYEPDGVWFKSTPLGINRCSTFVKRIMNGTGIPGIFSNHSLRTTTVNQLQDAGFPDSDVMARTGHRSVSSVAKYRRTNDRNSQAVSQVLEGNHSNPVPLPSTSTSTMSVIEGMTEEELMNFLNDDDFDESRPGVEKEASAANFDLQLTQLLGECETDSNVQGGSTESEPSLEHVGTQTEITLRPDEIIEYIKTNIVRRF